MEGYTTSGLWLFILLLGCGRLSAFNLDTENVLRRDGEPGSLFGFSLAMHQQLSPKDKRILLVGAPRAKAWGKQKSKVTGGLYKCEINPISNACERLVFDDKEDLSIESKENQWLGVSVNSQGPGGKVVTCAHRYQLQQQVNKPSETRSIIGRCYVLSQQLTLTSSKEEGDNWHFCKGREDHRNFGYCQQGLTATFDKDYHYYIFGAPGAFEWRGLVHLEQRNESFFALGIYFDGPFETGGENKRNPNLVPTPDNSYLGFSLDTGKKLTKKDQLTVVAGAPRAYYSGAVVLLKTEGTDSMVEEYTLKGEGLASSFGYDLTVLDLNGDGWEDIVVGAPQYFEKESEIGGAVYIYINKAGKWKEVKPTRINGAANSMFGLSVENLGDINQDGYHDFAVGSPYDDGGAGKVHIYHGSATEQYSEKASQVLSGKPLGVSQFGYSLAGNMDLDGNSYPDLAVGSLSDAVFAYKARPVVKIEKVVTFSPSKIDLSNKNCGNSFCLEVKVCFSYAAGPGSSSPTLTVMYNLEVDADRKKKNLEPRGKFTEPTDPENTYKSSGVITIDKKAEKCVTRKLEIKEDIRDKLLALPIDVSVNIQNAKRKRRQTQGSQLAPVLDAKDVKPTRTEVEFSKLGCGNDNVCQSNLKVQCHYVHKPANVDKFIPLDRENEVPMISLSGQKSVALEVTVSNPNGDDAYEASVVANFPASVTYSTYLSQSGQVSCQANTNGSMVDCDVGNPFKGNSETTFYILFDTTNMSLNTTEVEVELKLQTTSKQENLMSVKAKAKVAIVLQLSLSGQVDPSQVYFNEDVKEMTEIKTELDIRSAITHRFTIINRGKRLNDIGTATLHIEWPKLTEDNKDLLYLMKISSTELKQMRCSPTEEINYLKMKPLNRKRRATNEGISGAISRLIGNKKSKTLSCSDGAKCVTMKCPLDGLDNKAVIVLHSSPWNNTFTEEYSKFHYVEVMVKASLHVQSMTKNTLLEDGETEIKLIAFPERRVARYGGVAWWIILLSLLFILLWLALLAFLLWKCGVCKKNKENPSDKEKLTSNA